MDKLLLKSIKHILQVVLNQHVTCIFFSILCLSSCSSSKLKLISKSINSSLQKDAFNNQFTGLLVVDVDSKDTITAKNNNKYFIPASTAKLTTLYSAIKLLPKQIPTLKYIRKNDSIYIEGTGDPSWLHPYFKDSTALDFLSKINSKIVLSFSNFKDEKFRPGWAWEDYQYYFSPELNAIPLYGNVVSFYETDKLVVSPVFFKDSILREVPKTFREPYNNKFTIPKIISDTIQTPYITSDLLTKLFIQRKINKEVILIKDFPEKPREVLYGIETDSILKRMLYESDNFLAEQLILAASSTLSDTLSFNKTKDFVLENYLSDLKQQPRWVDGSGLSRYNLFTPESMVQLLQKLYDEVDHERLFNLIPMWDNEGTIKNSERLSFIRAKSGSMGNTYNLCGYLKTVTGRTLMFSFMNNHFRRSSLKVRLDMYRLLKEIHDKY